MNIGFRGNTEVFFLAKYVCKNVRMKRCASVQNKKAGRYCLLFIDKYGMIKEKREKTRERQGFGKKRRKRVKV